jgi:hypothetical protein
VEVDEIVTVISRVVAVKPPGPDHDHDPPVVGCGPNFTDAPELTVALDVCCHAPPFTWRYGVIVVPVQPLRGVWVGVAVAVDVARGVDVGRGVEVGRGVFVGVAERGVFVGVAVAAP